MIASSAFGACSARRCGRKNYANAPPSSAPPEDGVNSAHPFENPTPLANFFELLAILIIPAALTYTFGKLVGDTRQGWALLAVMTIIFVPFLILGAVQEQAGTPQLAALGVDLVASDAQAGGNMEGKETRFGVVNSALWAAATTAASNGSVNSMHDSFTPLGGLVPMFLMQLGEVIFGGVGSGLYGMLAFAVVAVFISGLMVGRTPEYLGKKIEAFEMKMASLVILIPCAVVLGFTALAVVTPAGKGALYDESVAYTSIYNPGTHGFSEALYAYSSMGNNNGSAFAGLGANNPFWNTTGGIAMLISRYWLAIPMLAIAGMDRMIQANVIATSGRAVEAAGDVDVLLLDKTGTITLGNRQAVAFLPANGVTEAELADAAQLSSLADETPEGRSIVVLAKTQYNIREREVQSLGAEFVPFTAQTRMSGVNLKGTAIRKGAAAIAAEAGVDDFLAEATPEAKLALIREYQTGGRLVAMTGDGTNDAPALAQADVAVAMNSGTQAAKEAGNMVDLDSNPTKLIEVVEIGKQLLITRGSLTTFSIANDIAKYAAIIPAAFVATYPQLSALNVMGLASPASAIVSAVIFNAIIIPLLIPLALRGVRYRALGAAQLLQRNLLIYGLGGIITPFIGIKLIDLLLTVLRLV